MSKPIESTERPDGNMEHRWTRDGVEHVAYQCQTCYRWFDSPSVHLVNHLTVAAEEAEREYCERLRPEPPASPKGDLND